MSKVYQHRAGLPDKLLGRVKDDGRVTRSELGPDDQIGRVDLESGEVRASRIGPDKYIGRVDLESGRVYRHVAASSDEYLGRVNMDGRMDRHDAISPDEYMGKIESPKSLAYAGAAFLLLVLPAEDED